VRPGWIAGALVVAIAAAAAVVPLQPGDVERWYSTGVYPWWQPLLTHATNHVPFAVFDVIVAIAVGLSGGWLLVGPFFASPGTRLRALAVGFGRVAVAGAVVYLWFLLAWGLNYRRVPMRERLDVRSGAAPTDAVEALARRAVDALNTTYAPAHAAGWPREPHAGQPLRDAFARTQRLIVDAVPAEPGRLKTTVFGPYFRWTGVDGMVNPLALEVLANPDLLPFETPFVAAHEWAHLAGFADESEANFVGWLTCVRGDVSSQYSGWLFLYWQLASEVRPATRTALAASLEAGPRADIEAIADRLRRGQLPPLREASWAMYDQYLKANRVEAGVRSYGLVVTLLVQARFTGEWEPVRRRRTE
jgi:hypothetical protein